MWQPFKPWSNQSTCTYQKINSNYSPKVEVASGGYLTSPRIVIALVYIKTVRKLSTKMMIFKLIYCCQRLQFWRAMTKRPYPASRGYIFAVWAGVRKVASADNRSIFYRACAKFVTRFASNWFVKSAWVSRESNLRKLANYCPRAFVLFFCFAPSGLKYFSRKISTDRLF